MPEIRLANLNDYKTITSFIDQYWKKNHSYTQNKELFDWTFFKNPSWEESGYSISLAIEDDSVLGMLGIIPFNLNIYGKSHKACWLVNWLLIPNARKGRTGLNLLYLFTRKYGYDTISFGINDTIARLYSALKWQEMPVLPRMVWINPNYTHKIIPLLSDLNINEDTSAIKKYVQDRATDISETTAETLDLLELIQSGKWDINGWGRWKLKTIGCSRDLKYLNWRYAQHPVYHYETRAIMDGIKIGLIIWRIENVKGLVVGNKLTDNFTMARIVEFIPTSKDNGRALLSEFIRHSNQHNVKAADFYCYNKQICQLLSELGFFVSKNYSGVQLPNYTQPLDLGTAIRSSIKIADAHKVDANSNDWYWTRSDSDQDRPNS